jgi:YfiH family protein
MAHAFSTRVAFGRTDFDLGMPHAMAAARDSHASVFLKAAGLGDARPSLLRQVHGGVVVDASAADPSPPLADGAFRRADESADVPVPAVRTADCVPILLADRSGAAFAALHAGWRGTAAGIARIGVLRFATEGIDSRELVVALGPAILGCCYEVGDDVVTSLEPACGARSALVARTAAGRASVDLHAALRAQLTLAGVSSDAIHAAPWCTRCRTDLFFSFRAEGPGAGRLMAAAGPAARP